MFPFLSKISEVKNMVQNGFPKDVLPSEYDDHAIPVKGDEESRSSEYSKEVRGTFYDTQASKHANHRAAMELLEESNRMRGCAKTGRLEKPEDAPEDIKDIQLDVFKRLSCRAQGDRMRWDAWKNLIEARFWQELEEGDSSDTFMFKLSMLSKVSDFTGAFAYVVMCLLSLGEGMNESVSTVRMWERAFRDQDEKDMDVGQKDDAHVRNRD